MPNTTVPRPMNRDNVHSLESIKRAYMGRKGGRFDTALSTHRRDASDNDMGSQGRAATQRRSRHQRLADQKFIKFSNLTYKKL